MAPDMDAVNDLLARVRHRKYEIGTHDCLTFTNALWAAAYGQPWCDADLGAYSEDECPAGVSGPDAVDRLVGSVLKPSDCPRKGDLVAVVHPDPRPIYHRFGFCLGAKSVFIGKIRTIYISTGDVSRAWGPTCRS